MKNKFKVLLLMVMLLVLTISISIYFIISFDKNSKTLNIKKSLENIFFYLDNDKYNDMNNISEFCKISLVYGTNDLKSDYSFYEDDTKVNGYTKNSILKSLKKILGNNATIDFDNFIKDNCIYNNKVINLTYNSKDRVIYTSGNDKSNRNIVVDWFYEKDKGNTLVLKAHALMIVENEKYDLYIDNNMEYLIGSYNTFKEAKRAAKDNMLKSFEYVFKLNKENGNYIWKSLDINRFDEEMID